MSASKIKSQLRREQRRARSALTARELRTAAQDMARHATQLTPLLRATRIASYRSFAGEINPEPLEQQLGARVLLPKISNFRLGQMQFYAQDRIPKTNRLGIEEPRGLGSPTSVKHLDVVLVPLVAFQRDGNRLGMGAGFYDRALAFRRNEPSIKRPLLIGLAHHFQETNRLQPEPWDVPLDAIITDVELIIV